MPDNFNRPLKVFLCHASADKPAVRDLYKRLVADGVDAWLDAESLVPGQNWQVEIPKAIREANVVLVCLSEKSINKEGYVQKEIKFALDVADEKPEGTIFIIPARLEECKVPDRLGMYHWVDLFEANGYPKLMGALRLRADKIGAVLQAKKGWLGNLTSPTKKSDTQKPKPVVELRPEPKPEEPKPVVAQKPPRKWSARMIAAIAGVVVIFVAIFGLPWNQWFAAAPDIATVTPTNTVVFPSPQPTLTKVSSTSTSTPVLPAKTKTPTIAPTVIATSLPDEIIDDNGVPMSLVPEGGFTMGSEINDDEKPIHQVYLNAFYMDKYEVTNALYKACVDTGGCTPLQKTKSYTLSSYYGNSEFDDYPVIYVDWNQAKTYCDWRDASLPTEAQWEKAARGTDERTYPWGEGIDSNRANYNQSVGDTTQVGSYESGKSPYGIYDLAGNVEEWTADWYSDTYYQNSPSENPLGPASGQYRVLRGGSWYVVINVFRSANRSSASPDLISFDVGFRCARSAP